MDNEIREILKAIREEQKKSMELLLETSKRQEEEIAEMKKTICETKAELLTLQKQQQLSQTTESNGNVSRSLTANGAESAKFLISEIQHAIGNIDKIGVEFGNATEDLKIEIVETLAAAIAKTEKKVDDLQAPLGSFVIGQSGFQKQIACLSEKVEGLKKELHETREKFESQTENLNRVKDINEKQVEEGRNWELREKDEALLLLLTGEYYRHWMKDYISVENGKLITNSGVEYSLDEFKNAVKNNPWFVFPGQYEVTCWKCNEKVCVTTCLRYDKKSVKCLHCKPTEDTFFMTMLGSPKPGFEWMIYRPCEHHNQVPIGERPTLCGFCRKEGDEIDGPCAGFRTPTRKRAQPDRLPLNFR